MGFFPRDKGTLGQEFVLSWDKGTMERPTGRPVPWKHFFKQYQQKRKEIELVWFTW